MSNSESFNIINSVICSNDFASAVILVVVE